MLDTLFYDYVVTYKDTLPRRKARYNRIDFRRQKKRKYTDDNESDHEESNQMKKK